MKIGFVLPLLFLLIHVSAFAESTPKVGESIKIGWIGPLTGPGVKYGSGQAALMAADEINAEGGIRGRTLELVQEDGKSQGAAAVSAFRKLTSVDGVKFIVGGHCTPESAAVAPLASANDVVILAAVTTSPKLSGIDRNFFRVSHVSTSTGEKLAEFVLNEKRSTAAILAEETDYVLPVAEKFKASFLAGGGSIVAEYQFSTGDTDFRTFMTRLRAHSPQALYVGVQSVDSGSVVMKQLREAGIKTLLVGNEQFALTPGSFPELTKDFEGVVTVEPQFDTESPQTKTFISRFKSRFAVDSLPGGIWAAEAYDAVRLMAKVIAECGEETAAVQECLSKVKNYAGVSGPIGFNNKNDGTRAVYLKHVVNGRIELMRP